MRGAATWCRAEHPFSMMTWLGTVWPRQRLFTISPIAARARCLAMALAVRQGCATRSIGTGMLDTCSGFATHPSCTLAVVLGTCRSTASVLALACLKLQFSQEPNRHAGCCAGEVHVCSKADRRGGSAADTVCDQPSCRRLEIACARGARLGASFCFSDPCLKHSFVSCLTTPPGRWRLPPAPL